MFFNKIQEGRDSNNNPITDLNADRFNQPFNVKSVSYDSGADQINATIGVGRTNITGDVIEQSSETTVSLSSPNSSSTYHIFLENDGSYSFEETNNPIIGPRQALLARLDTPSDLTNTNVDDLTDLRNMLPGFSGRFIQFFFSDGTFNVGKNISNVAVTLVGGGGGGGGAGHTGPGDEAAAGGGGGGGAEALIDSHRNVTPGSDINVSVGSGGNGGADGEGSDDSGDSGGDGGSSSFGSLTVAGGSGGGGGQGVSGAEGGSGGSGGGQSKNPSPVLAGTSGQNGEDYNNSSSAGGDGGYSALNPGGTGSTHRAGNPGNNGSGGGGGGTDEGSADYEGGDGGDGLVIVKI